MKPDRRFHIRKAHSADASALASLAETSFRETYSAVNTAEDMDLHCRKNFSPGIQRAEIESVDQVTLLAVGDEGLAGFAQLHFDKRHPSVICRRSLELLRIYVLGSWQGARVGRSLMQHTVDEAVARGCDCIWLGVWEHNPKATAFYRKEGFEVVGEHTFQLGSNLQRDLIMCLRIPRA